MLDIGFAELLVVSAVALFVVGPERLPSAIRAISLWLGRVRRGFEEIKADVSRELHNEEVMRALRESRDEVQDLTDVSSALSLDPVALDPVALDPAGLDPVDQEKSGTHEASDRGKKRQRSRPRLTKQYRTQAIHLWVQRSQHSDR